MLSRRSLALGLASAGLTACRPDSLRPSSTQPKPSGRLLVPAKAPSVSSEMTHGNQAPPAARPAPIWGARALQAVEPALEALPWCDLLAAPSPVREVARAERLGLASLWLKDDARSVEGFGGSKPRKLEALLGAARAAGAGEVATFGAMGSNHVTACAVHAQRFGIAVRAYVLPAPVDQRAKRNLEICRAVNAELITQPSQRAAERAAQRWLGPRHESLILPWGGTSALGNLGMVAACAELAQQIRRGELPEPDLVFVAAGTLGTAAGLALGLAGCGLRSRLIPVRASNRAPYTQLRFAQEIAATRRLIQRYSTDTKWRVEVEAPAIDDGELGAGYAVPSLRGRRAAAWLRAEAGVELDQTYTAKAFAALLGQALAPPGFASSWRSSRWTAEAPPHVLFWQTSHDLSATARWTD